MNKVKVNPGLACIILLGALFAGWQTLITVIIFMYAFCEVDEKVKDTAINVSAFYLAYLLMSRIWDLIISAANTVLGIITKILTFATTTFDLSYKVMETFNKILNPLTTIIDIADDVASILFTLAFIGFVIAFLTGKAGKSTPISDKINEFYKKALDYVGKVNGVAPTPVQPVPTPQPMAQPVQQMPQPMPQPVPGQPTNPNNMM